MEYWYEKMREMVESLELQRDKGVCGEEEDTTFQVEHFEDDTLR